MPEVRRRGLPDQMGVRSDRTQPGVSSGGGIGPTIARLQQAYRSRMGSSSVAATVDGTTYTGTFSSLTATLTGLPDGVYGVTVTYEMETTDPTVSIYAIAYATSDVFGDVRTAETFPTGTSVIFTWSGFAVVQAGGISVSGTVSTTPTAETLTITAVRLGAVQF